MLVSYIFCLGPFLKINPKLHSWQHYEKIKIVFLEFAQTWNCVCLGKKAFLLYYNTVECVKIFY